MLTDVNADLIGCYRALRDDVEPVIAALLARPEVAYVHLRHTRAGCYLARIERAA